MARGIVAIDGSDLLGQYRSRIRWLNSEALSRAVVALLSGDPVDSADGEVEIAALVGEPPFVMLILRIATAPYVAEILLTPAEQRELDPRSGPLALSPRPCPDRWRLEGWSRGAALAVVQRAGAQPGVPRQHLSARRTNARRSTNGSFTTPRW